MPWLFCKICRTFLHACHALKTVFPEIFKNSVIFKKIFKNLAYTTCLLFKYLQNLSKCTVLTDYRLCCTAIVLSLHRCNILTIFKQLSALPFLQEDFTACFAYFHFEKMESTRLAKMNRKTTTRIILFV